MILVRSTCALVLLVVGLALRGYAQDSKPFPTDDEINLLLTQGERAMQQYKSVLAEEERLMGKLPADVAAVDQQVFSIWNAVYAALKVQPQKFNGLPGYAVLLRLNYAGKNALLCGTTALNTSTVFFMAGDTGKASSLIRLAQTCMNAATLLYTVSENAAALFEKYILAEEALARNGFEVAQKCSEALKKLAAERKGKQ